MIFKYIYKFNYSPSPVPWNGGKCKSRTHACSEKGTRANLLHLGLEYCALGVNGSPNVFMKVLWMLLFLSVEHILVPVLHSNNVVILDTKFIIMRRIETSWSNLFTIHLNLILLKWSKAKSYLKKIPIFDTEYLLLRL